MFGFERNHPAPVSGPERDHPMARSFRSRGAPQEVPSRRSLRAARRNRASRWSAVRAFAGLGALLIGIATFVGLQANRNSGTDTVTTISGPTTAADAAPVELGLRFSVRRAGHVTGIVFEKSPQNTGEHIGTLWSSDGKILGRGTFQNETAAGRQELRFEDPVPLTPRTEYVASYWAPAGHYTIAEHAFDQPSRARSLLLPADAGVYRYGGGFPTRSWRSSDYQVRPVFVAGPIPAEPTPVPR